MPPRKKITDPDVRALAVLASTLEIDYADSDKDWRGSPFEWIKQQPSRKRGAIGERLVAGWLASRDFDVSRSPDSEADRVINTMRVEIKFSSRWKNGGYKFQQIRDQNYKLAILLGICPFDAHCWIVPKSVLMERWKIGATGIRSQHGGARGTDTAWLGFKIDAAPAWLSPYGGKLRHALKALRHYEKHQS